VSSRSRQRRLRARARDRAWVRRRQRRPHLGRAGSVGRSVVRARAARRRARTGRDMTQSLLVVDDEPQFLRTLSTNLRGAGYTVETAETVQAALSAAKESQ